MAKSTKKKPADEYEHRTAMQRHTRPGLWGPASWWRAGTLALAAIVAILLIFNFA